MKFKAKSFRKISNSSNLEDSLKKAVKDLAKEAIPHLVAGGYARFTSDIDVIAPDVSEAREVLAMNGFKRSQGSGMTLTDRESKVEIDLLPGGGTVSKGTLPFPIPDRVAATPIILPLVELVSLKLSSYLASPVSRAKDLGDVVELIKVCKPPRDFSVDPSVKDEYCRVWDGLTELGDI